MPRDGWRCIIVAVAIGGAAVLGAGSSLAASSSASKSANNAANANNALQSQIYGENKAALSPYEAQGNSATTAINSLLGLGEPSTAYGDYVRNNSDVLADYNKNYAGTSSPYADINAFGQHHYDTYGQAEGRSIDLSTGSSPANDAFNAYKSSDEYQSRLDQGAKSVQAALGSKGLLDSGAAQKSLLNYGQTAASDEFSKYLGNLTGQQNVGLTAASAQAGVGTGYANATSANNNAAATASGNAALSGANSVNSALSSALTAYGYNQGLGSSYGGASANSGLGGIY